MIERLLSVLDGFAEQRVLVIGDLVADQFLYGEISRVSREAPVLILRHERTETVPGGAANCALNLARLGARVEIVGTIGADDAGDKLTHALTNAGIDCGGVIVDRERSTTTKVRVLAGGAHSLRQQVIRVDYEADGEPDEQVKAQLARLALNRLPDVDACIISDYNYGVAQTAHKLREVTLQRAISIIVDSRFRLSDFSGFTGATPNEDEVEQLCGTRFAGVEQLAAAGDELRRQLNLQTLLITRGKNGMLLLEANEAPAHISIIGSPDAVDVTGAGDTVIATYTLALASGATALEAAHLANHAGGIVVMKRGTATTTQDEIRSSLESLNR